MTTGKVRVWLLSWLILLEHEKQTNNHITEIHLFTVSAKIRRSETLINKQFEGEVEGVGIVSVLAECTATVQ